MEKTFIHSKIVGKETVITTTSFVPVYIKIITSNRDYSPLTDIHLNISISCNYNINNYA